MTPSKLLPLSAAALCALAVSSAVAQTTATSTPAGFVTLTCPANSDTRISIPLTRPPEFTGAVTTPLPAAGNVITVAGTPGWATNQFVFSSPNQIKTYYAIFGPATSSYAAEGKFFTVTANTSNTLTLDLAGDSLSSVPANAQIQLIPYWTFGTLFPASDAGISFIGSPSAFNIQTRILIPNHAAVGTDTATASTYYFHTGAGWKRTGDNVTIRDTDILPPVDSFRIRNGAQGTSLVNLGGVEMKKVTTPLATQSGGSQDNFVAIVRPVDVAIKDLGLSSAFATSASAFAITDSILLYDNSVIGTDKSSSGRYYLLSGTATPTDSRWRKVGNAVADAGNDVIPAGTGFVIRKASTPSGTTAFWTNDKTYNP
jgi:uncharacterized protein (TIGR02597 family)